jgi:hypothetical protein
MTDPFSDPLWGRADYKQAIFFESIGSGSSSSPEVFLKFHRYNMPDSAPKLYQEYTKIEAKVFFKSGFPFKGIEIGANCCSVSTSSS